MVSSMLIAWLLIGAALVVVIGLAVAYDRASEARWQRQETQRRIWAAERDIAEIGRQTRAAIMAEVQRRLRQGKR